MKDYDFSLEACMDSVKFEIEFCKENPFELLGKAIIRAKQDPFYNKTMIEAYEKYIEDNGLKWDSKVK